MMYVYLGVFYSNRKCKLFGGKNLDNLVHYSIPGLPVLSLI